MQRVKVEMLQKRGQTVTCRKDKHTLKKTGRPASRNRGDINRKRRDTASTVAAQSRRVACNLGSGSGPIALADQSACAEQQNVSHYLVVLALEKMANALHTMVTRSSSRYWRPSSACTCVTVIVNGVHKHIERDLCLRLTIKQADVP